MTPADSEADQLPPLSPEEEATLQKEIEIALEPYRKITPASLLPTLRDSLERALRTHPVPRQLLRAFAPRTADVVSGDGPVGGALPGADQAGGNDGA